MTTEELSALKTAIEAALVEASKGAAPRSPHSPASWSMPFDAAWALVTPEAIRELVADRAVKAIGGTAFNVAIDENAITVTAASPQPTPAPAPSPTPEEHS